MDWLVDWMTWRLSFDWLIDCLIDWLCKHDTRDVTFFLLLINSINVTSNGIFSLYFSQCKFCGKSFASHAAHDSHVRRSHLTTTASAASRRATPTTTTTTAATTPNSYNAEDEDEDDPEVEMLLGDHRHRPEEENDLNDDDDEETDKTLVDV